MPKQPKFFIFSERHIHEAKDDPEMPRALAEFMKPNITVKLQTPVISQGKHAVLFQSAPNTTKPVEKTQPTKTKTLGKNN